MHEVHNLMLKLSKLKQGMNDKHNRAYNVTYTSPQSQNEFLSILGLEVKEKIAKDIKGAGVFSSCPRQQNSGNVLYSDFFIRKFLIHIPPP